MSENNTDQTKRKHRKKQAEKDGTKKVKEQVLINHENQGDKRYEKI